MTINHRSYVRRLVPLLAAALLPTLARIPEAIAANAVDYENPRRLVGNIYSSETGPRKLLFKSERKAFRTGGRIEASCDYTSTDGSVAARDKIVYEGNQLISFEEEQCQTGEKGVAIIRRDAGLPAKGRIEFEYTTGLPSQPHKSSASEALQPDTLIDDMIPAFIESHWDSLQKGAPAKFRYIVLSRKETVGFKLVKDSEATRDGQAVVRIKMEPTSFIIAQLVDPLFFVVEKGGQHRILEYVGRTTPMVKAGNKWKDLDAVSVFEWN